MIGLFEEGKNQLELDLGFKLFYLLFIIYCGLALVALLNSFIIPAIVDLLIGASYLVGLIFILKQKLNTAVFALHINGMIYTFTNCYYFGFDYGFQYYCLHTIAFCYVGIFAYRWQIFGLGMLGLLYYIGIYLMCHHGLSMNYHLKLFDYDLNYWLYAFHVCSISIMFTSTIITMRNKLYTNVIDKNLDNLKAAQDGNTDILSGLLTRVAFFQYMEDLNDVEQANIALIDIDNFKLINDFYGMQSGDEVIATAAKLIKSHFDKDAIITRWGGEEFLIFCQNSEADAFFNSCNEFLKDFASKSFNQGFSSSCSAGCLFIRREYKAYTFDEYLVKLEKNLFEAKTSGRSKIVSTSF